MNDDIRTLIDRFLDGATTPAEEQTLYSYFSSESVEPELEQYRAMFAWYASLPGETPVETPAPRPRHVWWHIPAGIAAAMALFVAIALAILSPQVDEQEALYAMYQGSYIEVNGERITDIRLIYDRLQQAEAFADSIGRAFDDEVIKADMVDQALRGISDAAHASQLRNDIIANS